MKKYSCLLFFFLISFTIWSLQAEAQGVSVSGPMVVDVTTRSFSVAWTADKPSTPQLEVFSDPDGLNPISVPIINVSQSYPPQKIREFSKLPSPGLLPVQHIIIARQPLLKMEAAAVCIRLPRLCLQ